MLHFEIIDTGIGISEEAQTWVFDKFSQADTSTTRRYHGTGLGLSICRQLVGRMGGEIGMDSTLGEGTKVWFNVRFGAVDGKHTADPVAEGVASPEIPSLRVLVVDDIEINRDIFKWQLSTWGMENDGAASGEAALAVLSQAVEAGTPYDVALIDHAMPGMDGEELGRRIKATPGLAATKLILAGSMNLRGDAERFKEIGFADCLYKPVRRATLLNSLLGRAVDPDDAARDRGAAPAGGAAAGAPEAGPVMHILVAEDNQVNQLLASVTLEKEGHRVDVANNGIEAVEAVRRVTYDLILMDVNMPEMDGVTATRKIRELGGDKARIPIVALTADAMKGDRERLLAQGMDEYVSKPLERDKLLAILAAYGPATGNAAPNPALAQVAAKAAACEPESIDDEAVELDTAVMDNWQSFFSPEEFIDLVTTQVADARISLQNLKDAAATGDQNEIKAWAHNLKSGCGALGLIRVQAMAMKLEHACREGRGKEALAMVPTLLEVVAVGMTVFEARYAEYIQDDA